VGILNWRDLLATWKDRLAEPRRRRAREATETWRLGVLQTLISEVLEPDEPWQQGTALSFLQSPPVRLTHAVRVDLFLPEIPLAIDVLGPEARGHYRDAQGHLTLFQWQELMEELAWKRQRLARYRCPYLTVDDDEAVDSASLRERIRTLTGTYPNR
jgi:hypothetical protein